MAEGVVNPGGRSLLGRFRRRMRETLPFGMWIATVAAVVWLASEQGGGLRVSGFARVVTRGVAPIAGGSLQVLAVEVGQEVRSGQIVATLDSSALDLNLASAQAELARLEAELGKEAYELSRDRTLREEEYRSDLRRFLTDRDEAHIEVLKTYASIERDQVRLQGVELELNRLRTMDPGMVSPAQLEGLEIEERELRTRIEERQKLLEQQELYYAAAKDRAEGFLEDHRDEEVDPLLRPFEWSIAAQKLRLEEISLLRTQMTLRAPVSGRVAGIFRRPGEVVAAGEPVVSIVETAVPEVVAYVPDTMALLVTPGTPARVRRHADGGEVFDAVVLRTGAMMEQMPERIDPSLHVPQWGIPVFLSGPEGQALLPGERFTITFHRHEAVFPDEAAAPR